MTCREEILAVVEHLIQERPDRTFRVNEVIEAMRTNAPQYQGATVRTHVTSRMCINAPDAHKTTYPDFERINYGLYRRL